MKRWVSMVVAVMLAAASIVVLTAQAPGRADQTCAGPGSGDVGGLPKVDEKNADMDGNGSDDLFELFHEQAGTGNAIGRVTLDNGYQATIPFGGSVFVANLQRVRDVDQDGDEEVFALTSISAQSEDLHLVVLADCMLVVPDDGAGSPVRLQRGGGTFESAGVDCFAPSVAGKGVTTYNQLFFMNTNTYESTRIEYKLKVDDEAGSAVLQKRREETITLDPSNKASDQTILDWRAGRFNCAKPPKCDGKKATIQGTPAKDKINGTSGRDIVVARDAKDTIRTKGGKDLVCAGNGGDVVNGGAGSDTIYGQGGGDTLKGAKGGDFLFGGKGADTLLGGGGNDSADGGKGADTCDAETMKSC